MSDIGGASGKSGLDTNLQQGQFSFGPSQYDLGAIMNAVGGNQEATTNRYDQLGMGGSTPELQDLAQQSNLGQAAVGQEQTSDVTNPALNPALQPAETNLTTQAVLGADAANSKAVTSDLASAGQIAGTAAALG